jgi:hypothetical protein
MIVGCGGAGLACCDTTFRCRAAIGHVPKWAGWAGAVVGVADGDPVVIHYGAGLVLDILMYRHAVLCRPTVGLAEAFAVGWDDGGTSAVQ